VGCKGSENLFRKLSGIWENAFSCGGVGWSELVGNGGGGLWMEVFVAGGSCARVEKGKGRDYSSRRGGGSKASLDKLV